MKKILCFIAIAIIGLTSVVAQQTVTLTFTGRDQNNAYVRLDHVTIENLTRNWSETIWFPDTVYTLTVGTGVEEHLLNGGMQVMPNPFNGRTQVNIHSTQNEKAVIKVVDINGKKCAEYDGVMSEGDNYFEILLTTPQTYILSVQTKDGMQRVKMVNAGRAAANRIESLGGGTHSAIISLKGTSSHEFELGDEMQYQGYSLYFDSSLTSAPVTQSQSMDEEITLVFDVPNLTNLNSCEAALILQNETGFGNRITLIYDHEGNSYQVVQIGNQCWMKENLRTTHYSDGTAIPAGSTTSNSSPYYYDYSSSSLTLTERGYLYNWAAVMHGASSSSAIPSGVQGICPTGWHVPSDAEWTRLTDYVSSQSEYYVCDDTSYIAKALASTNGWSNNGNLGPCYPFDQSIIANNATGFGAMPAGYWSGIDGCNWAGIQGNFWSATENYHAQTFSRAWVRSLSYTYATVNRSGASDDSGLSVRCLRDGGLTDTDPTVTTDSATNVTETSAMLHGSISNPDNVIITAQGFEWKTTEGGTYTQVTASGTAMTYALTGLTDNTSYTYRAFVSYGGTTAYGEELTFTSLAAAGQPCLGTSTLTDVDGNIYNTVQIGYQCWMKENLRTTHYSDGTAIPAGTTTSDSIPYYYDFSSSSLTLAERGYLYNWPAVMHGASSSQANPSGVQGICPIGWHVPSGAEWTELEDYVGSQNAYVCGSGISSIAKALAATTGWCTSTTTCAVGNNQSTNNATSFGARPAGDYYNDGYCNSGYRASFWSATILYSNSPVVRELAWGAAHIIHININKSCGHSVRCLRDGVSTSVTEPTVTTDSATNVTETSAMLHGSISNPDNVIITAQGFEWKTTEGGTYTQVTASGTAMTYALTGLTDNTSYTYRAFVSYGGTTAYGGELTFTTLAAVTNPTVTTDSATNVTETSAMLHGSISNPDNVAITSQGFEWKTTEGGSYTQVTASGAAMTYALTGLTDNTSYTYRAFVSYGGTTAYGGELTFTTLAAAVPVDGQPCPGAPTLTDYDGNVYNTVQIGNQCWMKENLRTTHYSDGTAIPAGTTASSSSPYYYDYSSSSLPLTLRGYFYNWPAVMHGESSSQANPSGVQGICPIGWHVPSDAEWTALEEYVSSQSDYVCGSNPSHIAKALAATTGWPTNSWTCAVGNNQSTNNATGFSALRAGYYYNGGYDISGDDANFWSATAASSGFAWIRYLLNFSANVERYQFHKSIGYSVRCLRD